MLDAMTPMSCTPSTLLLLAVVAIAAGGASGALNITRLLEPLPEFGTFNSFLNRTGLVAEINRRQTITVLALDDGAMGAISGMDIETAADVLRVHVILDYYDLDKLHNMRKRTTILTTLFQSTGRAANMGFLNATILPDGVILMGSSAPHEPLSAQVVKMVLTRPYNISILQLNSAIIPQGIYSHPAAPPPPPPPPAPPAPAEPPTDDSPPAPAPAPGESDAPAADAPAADAPAADAPAPASLAPEGPAPSTTGDEADAPGPDADEDTSSARRVMAGGSVVAAVAMALLIA